MSITHSTSIPVGIYEGKKAINVQTFRDSNTMPQDISSFTVWSIGDLDLPKPGVNV